METTFPSLISVRAVRLIAKKVLVVLVIAIFCVGSFMLLARAANAQDTRNATSMAALKDKTAKLGAPKIQGKEAIDGKSAPALYFGSTKMNNNFTVVDEVAATLFVKAGDEYLRVATSVLNPDGSGRAVGTVLGGPALDSIKAGKSYFGEVQVLGTPYIADYEPIKDASGETIGVYFKVAVMAKAARAFSKEQTILLVMGDVLCLLFSRPQLTAVVVEAASN